jgi:hypothetical protein
MMSTWACRFIAGARSCRQFAQFIAATSARRGLRQDAGIGEAVYWGICPDHRFNKGYVAILLSGIFVPMAIKLRKAYSTRSGNTPHDEQAMRRNACGDEALLAYQR